MSSNVLKWILPLHIKHRKEKCDMFFSVLEPSPADSLLDVGGGTGSILGEFASLYDFFDDVQVVNIRPQCFSNSALPSVRFSIADGCALPFPNRSFDWVFSNAVIEHVGNKRRQMQFATEVRRVARRGYFVATPNRAFPVDPHTLLPFYHFLSPSLQRHICRLSLGYTKRYEPLDLLSKAGLLRLFPEATVQRCGFPVLPNNLVAYYKRDRT